MNVVQQESLKAKQKQVKVLKYLEVKRQVSLLFHSRGAGHNRTNPDEFVSRPMPVMQR